MGAFTLQLLRTNRLTKNKRTVNKTLCFKMTRSLFNIKPLSMQIRAQGGLKDVFSPCMLSQNNNPRSLVNENE